MVQESDRTTIANRAQRAAPALAGGLMLLYALRKRSLGSSVVGAAGASLIYYGATGQNPAEPILEMTNGDATEGVDVHRAVTINRPPQEVYDFWRQLENLPRFMHHLESVEQVDEERSRWKARMLGGMELSWEARITRDKPGEVLAWETLPEATIKHHGEVRFRPAGADEGTELHVKMSYQPPLGGAGKAFAQLLNSVTEQQIKEEIRHCKHILEAGEIPTIKGQPSGRKSE